jgi:hypothetical protein
VLLTKSEIRRSIDRVSAAFPSLSDWEHNNEINEFYSGFSLWGKFVHEPNEPMPGRFFITFDTHEATWTGHLTIGQPCFYWSSADCGDAHLLDTSPCRTLDDAITSLKRHLVDLFRALSGSTTEPGDSLDRGEE